MRAPFDYSLSSFIDLAGPDVAAMILTMGQSRTFLAGQIIEERGGKAQHMHIVEAGLVQLGADTRRGARLNVTRLGPGHSFGDSAYFLGRPTLYQARADTDARVRRLNGSDIDALMARSVPFSKALLAVASLRMQTALGHIADAATLPLKARVAKLLLSRSAGVTQTTPSWIAMRHIDLADALGVSRVSIGKAMKALSDSQLIELGYGRVRIKDSRAMRALLIRP